MNAVHAGRRLPFIGLLILLLATAWFYAPSLGFGFIWDDPLWYGRVVDGSLWDIVKPMPDFQFYRPGTMLYNRLFLRPDHTFDAPAMHAAQIGWHLLNVALAFALSRRLGLRGWTALAVGAFVACCPLSYQAVAWAAPQQPLVMALQNGAWLTYLVARRRQGSRLLAGLSLLLFLAALSAQESTVVLAGLPLLMEWVLRRRRPDQARRTVPWLALAYPLVATAFGLLWLQVPRQAGVTALRLEPQGLGYFAQGLLFPLLGWPGGYDPDWTPAPEVLLAAAGIVIGGLLAASWRAGRGRRALFGLAWALLGIAPSAAGLRYSYVSPGSRLFYYFVPGAALLWACALLPPAGRSRARRLWRAGGAAALGLVVLQSISLLTGFQRMYAAGVDHLAELVQVAQEHDDGAPLLFVNFPDRYAPRRPPYPAGYWGMTLAPVSVELGAFPAIATGRRPQTISRSMPWIDTEARDAGPYLVDMRGITTQPGDLYQLAHQVNAVYLSRYHPGGTFELQRAGAVTAMSTPECGTAVFGETLCLQEARVCPQAGHVDVTLVWLSLASAQPHDTVFVHLGQPGQPPAAQADGDVWLGMLPLTALQPGDTVYDHRLIPLPEMAPPGQEVRVGVYNRLAGERLHATTPRGEPFPDNAVVIGHLP